MAENEDVKSKRDLALERLRGKYPDETFEDDEQLFSRIVDDYDQYDKELAGYKEREGKFSDMFTSDPRSARLMMDWKDGKDPLVVMIELYGDDFKAALDDPEKREMIAEANKAYMERVAKEKDYEAEHTKNLSESLVGVEQLQNEYGLSDDQVDEAMLKIVEIAKDAMLGKFTQETVRMVIKALNYDKDVEAAGVEGEVRGKNTRAKEELRKPSRTDGTPSIGGASGGGRRESMPDLGAIDRYGDGNMSIFERGGEKRTPIRR